MVFTHKRNFKEMGIISRRNANVNTKWKWFDKLDRKCLFESQDKMKDLGNTFIPSSFRFFIFLK